MTSPSAALTRLMEGNARWVAGTPAHPNQDASRRREVAADQQPYAAVLSCVDSRVPPEIIFDTGVGDLLVVRSAGQTLDPIVTASVGFGPAELGIPLVVVLGHQRCAAVGLAQESLRHARRVQDHLRPIVKALEPAYLNAYSGDEDNMIREQTRRTTDTLRRNTTLAPLVRAGRLAIVGAYYSLDTGRVDILDNGQVS